MAEADPREVFRQEAQELLEALEQALLDLEQNADERELVDTAFRALHTIKGSGAMFGFDRVAAFTHAFETAFDRVRKGEARPEPALIATALAAKDHIRGLIFQPYETCEETGEAILADLRRIVDTPAESLAEPTPPAAAPAEAPVIWRIRMRLPKDALVTGTNPLLLLGELRDLGPCTIVAITDQVPPLTEMEPEACYLGWTATLTTTAPRSAIEDVFLFVADGMDLSIEPVEPARPSGAAATGTDQLGTILVESGVVSPDHVKAALAEQQHRRSEPGAARETASASIRVQAERLDELMDRVGELVIAQARLSQLAALGHDPALKSVAEEIERLAAELRGTTMGIRMVPIGTLFGRFRRLVHDLSRDLGKDIELVTEGEETELDKTVVERLADPLVHLIRNAADHGIANPTERAAQGKPGRGRIRLQARHAGTEVQLVVADDGNGLNPDRIRAKAEAVGLVSPGVRLSDAELYQLLTHPGFSTAEQITALSGRGVGMDVVKRTIEALRGTLDIASVLGQGTEMTLRLPLTLAIIDGLLVRIGRGRYAIPLAAVEECVELSPSDDRRSAGRSFLNLRGDLVPFLRLRELFATGTEPDPYQKVVIVSAGDLRVGLVVDQVIGNHQTVIKSLSKLHSDVAMFSGATILGDGSVALILDMAQLVAAGQSHEQRLIAS